MLIFIGVQTDVPQLQHDTAFFSSGNNASSMSPIPSVDGTIDLLEQIKGLEKLANRYRNTALRFQYEYEKSEAKNIELRESQTESSEMIDFLQTEKSTLAESLAELEIEVIIINTYVSQTVNFTFFMNLI